MRLSVGCAVYRVTSDAEKVTRVVQFTCSPQQLHDLTAQVSNATRAVSS